VQRLANLLSYSGHKFKQNTLETITKFCKHYQLNSKAPERFKFTLKDDIQFNYYIVVDIVHLEEKPTLHIVDEATVFQAAKFIPDFAASTV
jgi:hypothetical protein